MKKPSKSQIHKILMALFFIAVVSFMVIYFRDLDFSVLKNTEINWGIQVASFLVRIAGLFCAPLIWLAILEHYQTALPYRELYYIYAQSWVGRYVPGKVVYIGSKIYLSIRAGMDKIVASVSTFLDGILQFAATLYIAALFFIISDYRISEDKRIVYSVYAVSILMIICLVPKIFNAIVRSGYYVIKRNRISPEYTLTARPIIKGTISALTFKIITGVSAGMIALAVYPGLSPQGFILVIAINSVASCIGMIAFFTPAGLGVREGFSIVLLSLIFPRELVLVIVLITAIQMVIGDVVFFLLSLLFRKVNKSVSGLSV